MSSQKKLRVSGILCLSLSVFLLSCTGRLDSPETRTLTFGASPSTLERNKVFFEGLQEQVFAGFEGVIFVQNRTIPRANLNLDSFRKTRQLHLLTLTTKELFSIFFARQNALQNYCSILTANQKKSFIRQLPQEMEDRLLEEGWQLIGTIIGDGWVVAAPSNDDENSNYRVGIDAGGPDPKVLNALGLAPVPGTVSAMSQEFGRTIDKALVMPSQVTKELIQSAPNLYPAGLEAMPKFILVRHAIKDDLNEKEFKFLRQMIHNAIEMQHSKNLDTNKQLQGLWKSWGATLHQDGQNLSLKPKCAY